MWRFVINELIERYPILLPCESSIQRACEAIIACYHAGGKVMTCGNGGSAADAEHIVGELMKSFRKQRPASELFQEQYYRINGEEAPTYLEVALPAISLVSQSALMTAFSNDENAVGVFAQQVFGYGRKGDVLIAISTSGCSPNVVDAAKVAKALGVIVVALTGEKHSSLSEVADITIQVPCSEVYQVQELHLPVYHAICAATEAALF